MSRPTWTNTLGATLDSTKPSFSRVPAHSAAQRCGASRVPYKLLINRPILFASFEAGSLEGNSMKRSRVARPYRNAVLTSIAIKRYLDLLPPLLETVRLTRNRIAGNPGVPEKSESRSIALETNSRATRRALATRASFVSLFFKTHFVLSITGFAHSPNSLLSTTS